MTSLERKTCSLELHGNMDQYAMVVQVFHTLFLLPMLAFLRKESVS